ncbi:MAG: hypothetical protein Kow0047_21910 [Anaerolineae bacterium]
MKVGIVAIPLEADVVASTLSGIVSLSRTPAALLRRGRRGEMDVWLISCGVGPVNGALATSALLERERPDLVVSCGSAGALAADLRPGEVVVASSVAFHDHGHYVGDHLVSTGIPLPPGRGGRLRDLQLGEPWRSRIEAFLANHPGRFHVGRVVTGAQTVFSERTRAAIRQRTGALAVDMESAAVAYTATLWGVPWLIVRGISDLADEPTGRGLASLVTYTAELDRSPGLRSRVGRVMRHPGALWRARRIRQAMREATRRAADVLWSLVMPNLAG